LFLISVALSRYKIKAELQTAGGFSATLVARYGNIPTNYPGLDLSDQYAPVLSSPFDASLSLCHWSLVCLPLLGHCICLLSDLLLSLQLLTYGLPRYLYVNQTASQATVTILYAPSQPML
jgi:hypothetical protein